jgi:hypothetical protein
MAMPPITFHLEMFSGKEPSRKRSQKCLLWLMEALTKCNELWLVTHPNTPRLYRADVRYVPELRQENWQDIPNILKTKEGDCEDLACWRVAELRVIGRIRAKPFISWRKMPNDSLRYHALVKWPDGRIEDPSLALGMRGEMLRRPTFINI